MMGNVTVSNILPAIRLAYIFVILLVGVIYSGEDGMYETVDDIHQVRAALLSVMLGSALFACLIPDGKGTIAQLNRAFSPVCMAFLMVMASLSWLQSATDNQLTPFVPILFLTYIAVLLGLIFGIFLRLKEAAESSE